MHIAHIQYIHTYIHMCDGIAVCKYASVLVRQYIHTYTHTYIHTYIVHVCDGIAVCKCASVLVRLLRSKIHINTQV